MLYISLSYELSLSLSAYLSVLRLWSADELPGDTQAIIMILELSPLAWKESLRIRVSLEARKGTWSALSSMARIHYFRASKLHNRTIYLLLMSAPSILLCLLLLWVSWALSEPAKSTRISFPTSSLPLFMRIWQMAWDLEEVSLATVAWVVLAELAELIMLSNSFASPATFYVNPWIWIVLDLSYRMSNACLLFSKSKHLDP